MPICACSVHPVLLCGWLLGCWSQWFLLHLLSLACEPLPLSPISPHLKITSSLSFLHPCSSSTSTSQENCHRAAKHRERETPPRIRSYRDVCWSSDLQWRCSKSLCWLHGSAHSIELMKRSLSGTHWSARLYSSQREGHLSFSSRGTGVICSSQEEISSEALSISLCPLPTSAPSFAFLLLRLFLPRSRHLLSIFFCYTLPNTQTLAHTLTQLHKLLHKWNVMICICSIVA